MLINDFRIINYKSYRETEPIPLAPGFNVFIGKNNSGKTALLEALSLSSLSGKPHRHSGIPPGQPLNPDSRVDLHVTLTADDLRRAFFNANGWWFPMPQEEAARDNGLNFFRQFMRTSRTFRFSMLHGQRVTNPAGYYPSHEMFAGAPTGRSSELAPNAEKTDFVVRQAVPQNHDNVFAIVGSFVAASIYSFRAERLSLASYAYGDNAVLAPNAVNLPVVLNLLQGQDIRFERFNEFARQIFPSIRRVSVRARGPNFEIMVANS